MLLFFVRHKRKHSHSFPRLAVQGGQHLVHRFDRPAGKNTDGTYTLSLAPVSYVNGFHAMPCSKGNVILMSSGDLSAKADGGGLTLLSKGNSV